MSKKKRSIQSSERVQTPQVERISYSMEAIYTILNKNKQKIVNTTLIVLLIVGVAILVNDIRIKNAYKLDGIDSQDFSKDIDSNKNSKELPLKGTSIRIPCEDAKKIDPELPCNKTSDDKLKK